MEGLPASSYRTKGMSSGHVFLFRENPMGNTFEMNLQQFGKPRSSCGTGIQPRPAHPA
jgi:hypothetical protein